MHFPKLLAVFATLAGLNGCSETAIPFSPEVVDVPAAIPAMGPRLSGGSGDPLILSWMEEDDSGASLHFSRWTADGWSEASVVIDDINMFVNWADMPSVQPMGDDRLAAHWLEKSAEMTYAYDVVFVQSADGGNSWSEPVRPHTDGTPTEHGFVSMYRDGDRTGMIWLDGRKMVNEATEDPVASGMTLRAAFVDADSTLHDEQLVDELICDCCQTDIAVASSGPVAVYRDRSTSEIRDISVTRFIDGRWQPGSLVGSDNWEIPGCPVNGPSITANGNFVAVARFTAAGGQPKVKLVLSQNSGESFGDEIEVASGKVLGRVGLAHLGDDEVAVSWLQTAADGSNEVLVRRYGAGGEAGTPHVVARDVGSFSVPQIALTGNDLVFAWTTTANGASSTGSASVAVDML